MQEVDYCGPGFFYKLQISQILSSDNSNATVKYRYLEMAGSNSSSESFKLELTNDAHNISIIAVNDLSENNDDTFSLNPKNIIQIPIKRECK